MSSSRRLFLCFAALLLAMPSLASAQAYPDRPIRMLVGFSPGGFTDVLARLIAQKLQERLGQPVVVENKPGAAGTIAADAVAKAKPDGYTLLMGHSNSNSIAPALYPKLPYDVVKDFTPIVMVASTPFILTVHPSVPATDVQTFIAYAKKETPRFASSGNGSGQHLAAEQFMLSTGVKMTHIPYKGSGQAITDLLSGQVELNFESPPNTLQHQKAGKLKYLGVTSAKRSSLMPNRADDRRAGTSGLRDDSVVRRVRSARVAEADRRQAEQRDQRDHEVAGVRREDRVAGRRRSSAAAPKASLTTFAPTRSSGTS